MKDPRPVVDDKLYDSSNSCNADNSISSSVYSTISYNRDRQRVNRMEESAIALTRELFEPVAEHLVG